MEERAKANVLVEALPYLREFYGQTVVIKYGGHAMQDDTLKRRFAMNIVLLRYVGIYPIVVHGGGPQIGQMLKQLNIVSEFRNGLRITDDATLDVVEMVLVGKVNKEIVNLLNMAGGMAVGLSGKDGKLIKCRKLEIAPDPQIAPSEIIDLGKVGEVIEVNTKILNALGGMENFIPVIAPIGVDSYGQAYNINADSVAGAVAAALKAKKLILLTDVPGILDQDKQLITSLSLSEALEVLSADFITGGMIPKITCCINALKSGVEKAHIVDGRESDSIILEMFTPQGCGTQIYSD